MWLQDKVVLDQVLLEPHAMLFRKNVLSYLKFFSWLKKATFVVFRRLNSVPRNTQLTCEWCPMIWVDASSASISGMRINYRNPNTFPLEDSGHVSFFIRTAFLTAHKKCPSGRRPGPRIIPGLLFSRLVSCRHNRLESSAAGRQPGSWGHCRHWKGWEGERAQVRDGARNPAGHISHKLPFHTWVGYNGEGGVTCDCVSKEKHSKANVRSTAPLSPSHHFDKPCPGGMPEPTRTGPPENRNLLKQAAIQNLVLGVYTA